MSWWSLTVSGTVSLVVFQNRHPRAIIIQLIRQLPWTATKATSENLIFFFWKITGCKKN